jgi:tRNA-splicing ligase RtcB
MAMPDAHLGYGFPIGGVAAFREGGGVISPGGVGFDINCGVRMLRTDLSAEDVAPMMTNLVEDLFHDVPSGVGAKGRLRVSEHELDEAFTRGAAWAVEAGFGVPEDLEHCEERGRMEGARPDQVSLKARKRGRPQLGTLGSGNHFLEIQRVRRGLRCRPRQKVRPLPGADHRHDPLRIEGAGHQICTAPLQVRSRAVKTPGKDLPDPPLACAPLGTPEAENYFGAMAAAANYAWANRQIISAWTREVFERYFPDARLDLVYDVAHNVAKVEEHEVDGSKERLYVHRKGATRAFGPGRPEIPAAYREVGQPVIIPGSMGTPSYVLCGSKGAMRLTFGSACHGAGRIMSRTQAKKTYAGKDVKEVLARRGIKVMATAPKMLAEEAPEVYKPSGEVVDVVHQLDIARKVARVVPLGVSKG